MEPVERVSGTALPLGYSDVDTDQIVPSDALKRIERTGFGQFLFSSWREDEDFIMHREEHKDAVILLAGENFGSGFQPRARGLGDKRSRLRRGHRAFLR